MARSSVTPKRGGGKLLTNSHARSAPWTGTKGSWRRPGAAAATTKAPYRYRAAKHEAAGVKPALASTTPQLRTRWIASPATENARHSVALRSAQLTMLRLRLRRHCRRCHRASHAPRSPRPACGCAPRGCDSATRSRRELSTKRRVSVAVDLRPSSVQLGQHSPLLHHNLPDPRQCPARACGHTGHGRIHG